MARIIRSLFRNGAESVNGGSEFRDMRYNDLYDFDEDRPNTSGGDASNRAFPHQQCRKVLESFGKGEFVVYDRVGGLSRPPSRANSQGDGSSEVVGGGISTKVRSRTPTPQPLVVWRPSSAGKSRPGTPSDLSRPMSSMRGAGYSSGGNKLDSSSLEMQQKGGANVRAKLKELEQRVHKLLEESTEANLIEAIQSFEAAMEIKYDQQTGYNLIISYSLLGNIQKMKSCFTKMLLVRSCYDLEFDSEKEELENSLVQGDLEGAKLLYNEVIQMEPDCIQALYNLGLTQKKLGRFLEALDTFSNLAKILPNNIKILYQVGHMNKMVGNREEAIKWLEMVMTKAMHDAGVLETLGSLYEESEDEPKALHYFTEAFQAHPVNMNVVMWLGAYYVKKEHFEKAINYFEIASKIEPKEAKWQLLIASCLRRTGAYSKALVKYKEILLIHPRNIECLRYLVHMCTSLGNHEEAQDYEAQLKKAERDIPSCPLLERGRGDLAMKEKGRMEIMILPYGTTTSTSLPLMPQWTLTTSTKRKRLQDEWEITDDLLPM